METHDLTRGVLAKRQKLTLELYRAALGSVEEPKIMDIFHASLNLARTMTLEIEKRMLENGANDVTLKRVRTMLASYLSSISTDIATNSTDNYVIVDTGVGPSKKEDRS